jgi:hypothetical protein
MALTIDQLLKMRDDLETTMNQGVSSISVDGTSTAFATEDNNQKALMRINARIAALQSTAPKGYSYAQFSKDGRGNS